MRTYVVLELNNEKQEPIPVASLEASDIFEAYEILRQTLSYKNVGYVPQDDGWWRLYNHQRKLKLLEVGDLSKHVSTIARSSRPEVNPSVQTETTIRHLRLIK